MGCFNSSLDNNNNNKLATNNVYYGLYDNYRQNGTYGPYFAIDDARNEKSKVPELLRPVKASEWMHSENNKTYGATPSQKDIRLNFMSKNKMFIIAMLKQTEFFSIILYERYDAIQKMHVHGLMTHGLSSYMTKEYPVGLGLELFLEVPKWQVEFHTLTDEQLKVHFLVHKFDRICLSVYKQFMTSYADNLYTALLKSPTGSIMSNCLGGEHYVYFNQLDSTSALTFETTVPVMQEPLLIKFISVKLLDTKITEYFKTLFLGQDEAQQQIATEQAIKKKFIQEKHYGTTDIEGIHKLDKYKIES